MYIYVCVHTDIYTHKRIFFHKNTETKPKKERVHVKKENMETMQESLELIFLFCPLLYLILLPCFPLLGET